MTLHTRPQGPFSQSLWTRELIHILIGVGAGFFPWLRPWNLGALCVYAAIKEGLWDPIKWCGKPLWKLGPEERPYRWGAGDDQVIFFQQKCVLDAFVYGFGALLGHWLYRIVLGG